MNDRGTVCEFQHEQRRPRAGEALLMLQKIASLVKPIMRQHGWKVGVLAEFWPSEQQLLGLNVNRGSRICLRLRYAGDEAQFLPLEDVTDTMLHELCHNVHGPHNEPFHSLWNELRDEHEALLRKGYTGEGFLSVGQALGGRFVPNRELQRQARASIPRDSARKLGGARLPQGKDIRQVIADAATRRMKITQGCAVGSTSLQRQKELVARSDELGVRSRPILIDDDLIEISDEEKTTHDGWSCRNCTLINSPLYLFCEACGHEPRSPKVSKRTTTKAIKTLLELEQKQPPPKPMAWECRHCGQFVEQEWWTCVSCGRMKESS